MQYRKDRYGHELSALGYGCMRFTRKAGGIDLPKAEREILKAVELGVNYFDTAYLYPGSEAALGEIVERNGLRERVRIATKLPQYLIRSRAAVDRYFDEELKRLRTDHVDYYLMHMLTDLEAWEKLVSLGIEDWIAAKKASGEIRQIGFSFHGNTDMFLKILAAYDWDFCQIQYNYMDEVSQAGRRGLEAAAEKGIPVIIMEPLRGGRLTGLLPREAKELIAAAGKKEAFGSEQSAAYTPARLGLRWLWDQPGVTVVLSGMNTEAMVEENCRLASEALPGCFTAEERALTEQVRAILNARIKVPCTGCGYCQPCPRGVDIPSAFRFYNDVYTEGRISGMRGYFQVVGLRKEPALPTQCIGCGKCEQHCPQGIAIIAELKKARKALLPLPVRAAIAVGSRFIMAGGKKRAAE